MNTWVRSLGARVTLGTQLCKTLMLRPIVGLRGSGRWLRKLGEESLGAVPPHAWEHFEPASRCIACGLCDAASAQYPELSGVVMGSARQPADAPLERERAVLLRAAAADLAAICPARVSAAAIAALIEDNAAMLGRADAIGDDAIGDDAIKA